MMGDFSWINMYGTTSHCVEGIDLKKNMLLQNTV
jgi:hypothetical protein